MQFGESGFAFMWLATCNRLLSALTKYFFTLASDNLDWKLIRIVRCYGDGILCSHTLCRALSQPMLHIQNTDYPDPKSKCVMIRRCLKTYIEHHVATGWKLLSCLHWFNPWNKLHTNTILIFYHIVSFLKVFHSSLTSTEQHLYLFGVIFVWPHECQSSIHAHCSSMFGLNQLLRNISGC